jgi:hypothetical protein
MDDKNMFEMMLAEQQKQELVRVMSCNEKTQQFGLVLTQEDAQLLMDVRKDTLKDNQRVEFGQGILPDIIEAFCDSQYLNQTNYVGTLSDLQEIFYLYKNEAQDEMTDRELIDFMRKQYESICFGDLEYLAGTCLERFARAVRSGYQTQTQTQHRLRDEYSLKDTDNEYNRFSEETRWDYEVYKLKLEDTY